jgi:hypothetical protein
MPLPVDAVSPWFVTGIAGGHAFGAHVPVVLVDVGHIDVRLASGESGRLGIVPSEERSSAKVEYGGAGGRAAG